MKKRALINQAVAVYGQQYNTTQLLSPKEHASCYTGALLADTGLVPIQGVVYRVTAEPIGAVIGKEPEPWMYLRNWAGEREVKEARQILRSKSADGKQKTHAREVIGAYNESKQIYRAHLKEYYKWLGVKQFANPDKKDES